MNVNVLTNPLKTFKVIHNIKRPYVSVGNPPVDKTIREFEFSVDLYPNYFDLTVGVWNVAISQSIVSNNSADRKSKASTIFHISTNLLSQAVKDPYSNLPASSRNVPLATIYVDNIKKDEFQLERLRPIFFQVENPSRFCFVARYFEVVKTTVDLNINIELTFLFQRLL